MAKIWWPGKSLRAHGKSSVRFDYTDTEIELAFTPRVTQEGNERIVEAGPLRVLEGKAAFKWIYREQPTPNGRIIIREKYYVPTQTWSQKKQDSQDAFSAAVAAWEGLTYEEQIVWNKLQYPENMAGRNRYIRWYMRQIYPQPWE